MRNYQSLYLNELVFYFTFMNPSISARSQLAKRWLRKKLLADISIWLFLLLYIQWCNSLTTFSYFVNPGLAFSLGYAGLGIFFFWMHTFTVIPLLQKRQLAKACGWLIYLYIGLIFTRLVLWFILADYSKAYDYVLKIYSEFPSDVSRAVWLKNHKGDSLITTLVVTGLSLFTNSFMGLFGILAMFPASLMYGSYARVKGWPGWIRKLANRIHPIFAKLLTTNLLLLSLNKIKLQFAYVRLRKSVPLSLAFFRSKHFAKFLVWLILGMYTYWVYTEIKETTVKLHTQFSLGFVSVHIISMLLFFWIHTVSNVPAIREKQYIEAFSRLGYLFCMLVLIRTCSWFIFIKPATVIHTMYLQGVERKDTEQITLWKNIENSKRSMEILSCILGTCFEIIISFIEGVLLAILSIGYGYWVKIKGWPKWIRSRINTLKSPTLWIVVSWISWLLFHFSMGPTGHRISLLAILYYIPTLLIPTIAIFYLNVVSTFRLLDRNKPFPAIFWTLLLWFFLGMVKVFLFNTAQTYFGMPRSMNRGIFDSAVDITSRTSKQVQLNVDFDHLRDIFWREDAFLLLLSFVLGFSRRATKYRRDSVRLAEEKQQELVRQKELENALLKNQLELSESRLKMLQYQINPHFLFNTLNFLYAKALAVSDPLADALMKLSETMRYSLKNVGPQTQFQLDEEIRHLQNYIQLNQLRFSERLEIRFEVEGKPAGHTILPLLLVTFVENAFKYGDLRDPANPVHIRLNVGVEQLTFWIRNKKRTSSHEESTGIGLANTRQRLESAYPNQHRLIIQDEPAFFTVQMEINFYTPSA